MQNKNKTHQFIYFTLNVFNQMIKDNIVISYGELIFNFQIVQLIFCLFV